MRSQKSCFAARPYRHFDGPLPVQEARELATSPQRVAAHSFYPFIHRTVGTPRYVPAEHQVCEKKREIAYAAHADSVIYSYYGQLLSEEYEQLLSAQNLGNVPVAYRRFPGGKCNIHFAMSAFEFIRSNRPCVALCFDIEGFFDHIDHKLLLAAWRAVLKVDHLANDHYAVFKSLTRWSWVDEEDAYRVLEQHRNDRRFRRQPLCAANEFRHLIRGGGYICRNTSDHGIPQGSPMSAVLSNIYMSPFDLSVQEFVLSCDGFYQRYCDDIFIVVPVEFCEEATNRILAAASERRITIHSDARKRDKVVFPADSTGIRVDDPIKYLGLAFDGERVLLRSQALSRYHRRLRRYLRCAVRRAHKNRTQRYLFKKKLRERFTYRGSRNFISYARRCAQITKSPAIARQVAQHDMRIQRWTQEFQSELGPQ